MKKTNIRLNKKIALIILIAILILQSTPYFITILLGDSISMITELYDPYDLFRGNYVQIQFEQENIRNRAYRFENEDETRFSEELTKDILSSQSSELDEFLPIITIPKDYFENDSKNEPASSNIYATLEQFDDVWKVTALSKKRPSTGIYIKATHFIYSNNELSNINFGIDRVYIPERTGDKWENINDDENYVLIADMKIFRGSAIITNLYAKKVK